MDDPSLVGGRETPRDLQREVHGLLLRNGTGIESGAEGLAFQKLHDGIGDTLVSSEVVDREDVWMRERRDRLGLPLEPSQRLLVLRQIGRQDFDSDFPIELPIPCPIHLAHTARANGRENLVRAEAGACRNRHSSITRSSRDYQWRRACRRGRIPAMTSKSRSL